MTRKDYIKLADLIKNARGDTFGNERGLQGIRLVTNGLVKVLAEDNPAFDIDRFLAACK